jgi:hypothetical protein
MAVMKRRRRVYLHVGTPKSGTSYLQDKLSRNRDLLERHGVELLRTRTGDHFEASLDLLGRRWAGAETSARGQWEALAAEGRKTQRHALVSHEILAGADSTAVHRALDSFPDHEPHVVLTVRDLGRQIPAEWQERVKHRARRDFAAYLKHTRRHHGREELTPFWRVQDVPRILQTWGVALPPTHVHLVTVPPAGRASGLLWERFAQVIGVDPRAGWTESETTNASLGGAEVTLLRRLNAALAERDFPREAYLTWVREHVVKGVLAGRRDSPRATVPPRARPWVEEVTDSWIRRIRELGVDVVGDLDDLRSVWPDDADGWADPDAADPALVAELAIEALAAVLDHVSARPVEPTTPLETGAVARLARRLRG